MSGQSQVGGGPTAATSNDPPVKGKPQEDWYCGKVSTVIISELFQQQTNHQPQCEDGEAVPVGNSLCVRCGLHKFCARVRWVDDGNGGEKWVLSHCKYTPPSN
jgi:hypothetical protein